LHGYLFFNSRRYENFYKRKDFTFDCTGSSKRNQIIKKIYEPLPMVMNGRYAVLFEKDNLFKKFMPL